MDKEKLKEKMVDLLRRKEIRLMEVPSNIRDEVAKEVYGRYPLKSMKDLETVLK